MTPGMIFAAWLGTAGAETPAADPAAQRISDAIRDHVAAKARVSVADVEIRWLGLSASIDCPSEPDVLVDSRPGEQFRGRTDLRVTLVAESIECGSFRLPTRIAIWTEAMVAARDTRPGEAVEFELDRVTLDTIRGRQVRPEDGPWISLRHLHRGEAVTDQNVRQAPAVFAGDGVQLFVGVSGLRVTADARMLNDAHIGDEVRVSNLATDTVVSGILIDRETVRVGGRK